MDYFYDVLGMFLSLDSGNVSVLAVYRRVRELSEFSRNILICVPKMIGGHMGLEGQEGE